MISRRTVRLAATVGPALVSVAIGVFAVVGLARLAAARDAVTLSRNVTGSLRSCLLYTSDAADE